VGETVERRGEPLESAAAAVVLLHGRGGTASSMFELASAMPGLSVSWLAPAAPGNTWYPQSFLAPIESNEPNLSRAIETVDGLVHEVVAAGLDRSRIVLLGFSQGACLAAEYALRHPARYGGLVLLTGGAIGPEGTTWEGPAEFDGTPVFAGTGDNDPHVPLERVRHTIDVLSRRGAETQLIVYPGMPHTVNDDELSHAAAVIRGAGEPRRAQRR
jgi:predicted esterase